jgi:hypothetical protein
MGRFVVRYRGRGPRPSDAVTRLETVTGARLIEDAGRTLLVEADEADLRSAFSEASLWVVAPEVIVPPPDPRHKVDHPPR